MNYPRQCKYVDAVVQGGIVVRLLGYGVLTLAAGIALGTLFGYLGNPVMPLGEQVAAQLRLLAPLLLAMVLVAPICVLHLVRFTNRFAGPVVRLRQRLDELAAGETGPELRFRDGDYWQDLAEAFNRVRANCTVPQKQRLAPSLQVVSLPDDAPQAEAAAHA